MTDAPFDPAQVRALATILAETGLTEIEIEGKDGRIRVARAHPPAALAPAHSATVHAPAPAAAQIEAAPTPAADDDFSRHPGVVLSPMVGIAYLTSDPATPPFVSVGQTVAAGQTLLLIEAMKTFNQIRAPKGGVVARILVDSGAPIEFGEPLMVLE